MKKRGVFFRGVQRKTVALVLALMLAMLALVMVVSSYRTRTLTRIVGETRTAQQESITRISEDTMHSALETRKFHYFRNPMHGETVAIVQEF